MSITLLRSLIAVAETGSFAAAADEVCVSQAAVGQQMRRLEQELGAALFDRSERSPRLTPLGHAVVARAREVVAGYDGLTDGLTGDGRLMGQLVVGAVPSLIRALVPMSIKRLVAAYPDLHTRVVPGLSDDLQDKVERGLVDAAVMSAPLHLPAGLRWQPFATEDFVLIAGPQVEGEDALALLATHPYIRHQRRTAAGMLAEEWLSRNRIAVRPAMEMESLETLASMVAHGLGVSVVPDACVPDAVFASLRKLPLRNPVRRVLGVLTLPDCPKRHLVEAMLTEIGATVTKPIL